MEEQVQVRGNYIREPCTTLRRKPWYFKGTDLAGVEFRFLSQWWQHWLECLSRSTDCRHSPSRTSNWLDRQCDRTRIRTDEPALRPLIFPLGRKIFRTACHLLQNILAIYLLWASQLKEQLIFNLQFNWTDPLWNFFQEFYLIFQSVDIKSSR